MRPVEAEIIHIVGRDTPPERLETLAALCAQPDLARGQRIVRYGPAALPEGLAVPVRRVSVPLNLGWLAARALRPHLESDGPAIVHAWSAEALTCVVAERESREGFENGGLKRPARGRSPSNPRLAGGRSSGNPSLLVDADVTLDLRRAASALPRTLDAGYACPTLVSAQRLLRAGVAAGSMAVIRDSVDYAALRSAERGATREALGLQDRHVAIIVLPPVTRAAGTFYAVWATMLLHKIHPQVRVLVCGAGGEWQRVRHLAANAHHLDMAIFRPPSWPLPELLAAADLAVFAPMVEAPVSGLAWAMAAGRPIVASAVPTTTELLVHGRNAWLCRPGDPKDLCRRMLHALERPEITREQAQAARAEAFAAFGRQRMIEEYRETYAKLAAGEPIGSAVL